MLQAILLACPILSPLPPQSVGTTQEESGIVVIGGDQSGTTARDAEIAELRRRLSRLEAGQAEAPVIQGTPEAPGFFDSIDVGLYGNIFGRRDSKRLVDEDGNEIDDRIRLRQVGLDLRAPLGPDAFAVLYLAWTSDPVNSFDADVEEGYVELLGLPLFPDWTRMLRFKGGRFRSSFGRSNERRIYEIPQITRPLPIERFLGQNGFDQTGFSVHLDVPVPENQRLVLTYEGLNNGDLPVSETDGEEAFADLCDLDWRILVGESAEVMAGVSFYHGKQNGNVSRRSELLGLDALFHRLSPAGDDRGEFWLGGEFIQSEIDRDAAPADEPSGWYVWSQYQLHADWHAGIRYGTAEELDDESLATDRYGYYVTYAENHSLRFTLGYEHTESDLTSMDGGDAILFEVNFAIGPESREPFWINR